MTLSFPKIIFKFSLSAGVFFSPCPRKNFSVGREK